MEGGNWERKTDLWLSCLSGKLLSGMTVLNLERYFVAECRSLIFLTTLEVFYLGGRASRTDNFFSHSLFPARTARKTANVLVLGWSPYAGDKERFGSAMLNLRYGGRDRFEHQGSLHGGTNDRGRQSSLFCQLTTKSYLGFRQTDTCSLSRSTLRSYYLCTVCVQKSVQQCSWLSFWTCLSEITLS